MAINIQNIIAALEAKVAAATSATETQELIVIIKSIKAAGQQTIVTYADVPNLPTASADNAGNIGYVAAVGKIYYSNGTTWTEVGSGSSGGGGGGTAYDQSLNTTDDVVFNSALIGDVSIIGNEIAVEDSYGLPATLNLSVSEVATKTDLNLSVDTRTSTTQTVTDQGNMNQFTVRSLMNGGKFTYSPMDGSSWIDAPKFVTGTNVSLTDGMNGDITITLTSDMSYNNMSMRWEADNTIVSGGQNISYDDYRSYTVILTNSFGDLANYSFDDQGTLTSPTISTNELLINGAPAGLLQINTNNSKSVLIDSFVSNTETINAGGASNFYLGSSNFRYSGEGSSWPNANKFLKDAIVTISYMGQTGVIKLTSDISYSMGDWTASYTLISGSNNGIGPTNSVTVYTESGTTASYDFTESGFIAESALIGDVSIIGNEIAVEDSYGLPATLNVSASEIIVKSNLDFTIDSRSSVTETITDPGNMNQFTLRSPMMNAQFTYSPMEGSSWTGASKFVTGTIVSITDGMYGTKVARLTSDMTYDSMDGRWEAGYTRISGSTDTGSDFRSYTVIVTNESGAIANYGFNDQGVLSTKSLLVDGVSPAFLVANQDGSKSVNVDSTDVTTYAGDNMGSDPAKVYWSYAQWSTSMSGYGAKTIRINGTNQKTIDVVSALVAGDKITFGSYDMANQGVTYTTVTVVSYSYDAMNNDHFITTVESNPNAGMGTDFSSSYGLSVESPVVRDYSFDANGAFTTPSIIAETALLGDVSVVANTVSASDSYGNPDTLIVDGGLDVKTTSTSISNYTFNDPPATTSEWNGQLAWSGSLLTWNNPGGNTVSLIQTLKVGDKVTFEDSMNAGSYVTVTLTSTMTFDMADMRYEATVAENNTNMSISSSNATITIASLVTKTSSFTGTGLNVDGTLTVNGLPVGGPTTTITSVSMAPINSDEAVGSNAYGKGTVFKTGSKVRILLEVCYNGLWTSTDITWSPPVISLPYTLVSGSLKTSLLNIDSPNSSVEYGLYAGENFSGTLISITKKLDMNTWPPTYVDVSVIDNSDQSLWQNIRHIIEINYETTQ